MTDSATPVISAAHAGDFGIKSVSTDEIGTEPVVANRVPVEEGPIQPPVGFQLGPDNHRIGSAQFTRFCGLSPNGRVRVGC